MMITFRRRKLARIFNSGDELIRAYGIENARVIMRRMMVLSAAPNLNAVPFSRPERRHELGGNRKGEFAVDLKHPFRLVFRPDHDPIPLKKDCGIDLDAVTAITILDVEDYH